MLRNNRHIINGIIISLFSGHLIFGQFSLTHDLSPTDMAVDSRGRVIFLEEKGELFLKANNTFYNLSINVKPHSISSAKNGGVILIDENNFYNYKETPLKINSSIRQAQSYFYDKNYTYYQGQKELDIISESDSTRCRVHPSISADTILGIYQINQRSYALTTKGMTELCLGEFVYYLQPSFVPTAGVIHDGLTVIVGSDQDGLWTFEKEIYKRLYVPGIEFPKRIKALKNDAQYLWILSHDAGLQVFDWNKQVLTSIDKNAKHFGTDKWNTIYVNDGNKLNSYTQLVNENVPDLNILKITDGNNTIDQESTIKPEDNLYVYYLVDYTPSPKSVTIHFRTSKNERFKEATSNPIVIKKLKPGRTELEIKASHDGKYFSQIQTQEFNVGGSSLGQVWKYVFGGLFFLLGLSVFSLLRNKRDLAKLEGEKVLIRKELELLKTNQRYGQLQLNPHFLFNVLNSIGGLIALNKNKESRQALNQFSKLMRSTLDHSKEENISLDSEVGFLKNYLEMEKLIRNNSFSYTLDIDTNITSLAPMIIQPFLENAIIHGLSSKKEGGKIECTLKKETNYIDVVISDNGIGRAAAAKLKSSDHVSSGIAIIKERLSTMDRWSKNINHVTYEDLIDENQIPKGTRVTIKIPNK